MVVYKITNTLNGMAYIGITTKTVDARWRGHLIQMRQNNNRNLYVALRQYGLENFVIEQIESANSLEHLGELEAKYIKQYDCFGKNGYNMTVGGYGSMGHVMSDAHKEKLRAALANKPPCSDETRKKLSVAAIGRKIPREAVERQVAKRTGIKRTPEQCAAIAAGRIGKGLKNDAARKHPKEIVFKALELIKAGKKQSEIVLLTGLTQPYISRLKNNHRGLTLQGV